MAESRTRLSGCREIWRTISAAPHRMFFLGGAAQLMIVMIWWSFTLAGRYGMLPGASGASINPTWAHAFLMLYGLFPFFIFGFLITVYPRWMNTAPVPRAGYVAPSLTLAVAALLFYVGLYSSTAVVVLAVALYLFGWALVLAMLFRVYRQTKQHSSHERVLNLALMTGLAGVASFAVATIMSSNAWFELARELGLWLFLVPVLFSVSHRMIPFFGSSVLPDYPAIRPAWSLPLVLIFAAGHVILRLSGQMRWLFVSDFPLMLIGIYHTVVWGFRRSFQVRLLAMLHIAFLWLSLAMGMYGVQSLVLFYTGRFVFGFAPLHALGIGFILGMVVAMVSRVSLGHSGRTLAADRLTWYTLFGVNLVAILRIAGELLVPIYGRAYQFYLAAAGLWLVCLAPWLWRYVPMYLQPRVDDRPG